MNVDRCKEILRHLQGEVDVEILKKCELQALGEIIKAFEVWHTGKINMLPEHDPDTLFSRIPGKRKESEFLTALDELGW